MQAIKFTIENRHYTLNFNHLRIIQISGGKGKSLFCKDFEKAMDTVKYLKNSIVINYKNPEKLSLITEDTLYDYVIIDNADTLFKETDRIQSIIRKSLLEDSKTHWVIIGRNFYSCVLSLASKGSLITERKGNDYYIEVSYSQPDLD